MTGTAVEVVATLLAARREIPELAVVVKGDCLGREWVIDYCHSTVYLSADVPKDRFNEVVIDALVAIVAKARRDAAPDQPQCGVPQQRCMTSASPPGAGRVAGS